MNRLDIKGIKNWIIPLVIGAIVGLAASLTYAGSLYVWSIFHVAIYRLPKLVFPFILLSFLLSSLPVRMFLKRRPKDTFDSILEYYHTNPNSLNLKETLIYSISSLSSYIFGSPVGPEGAAAVMGAGISNKIKSVFGTSISSQTIILTGLASGFTAIFKTPLSGFLLALELPYKGDLEKEPFLSAALATATSYLVSLALNTPPIIYIQISKFPTINIVVVVVSLIFGAILGFISIGFVKLYRGFNYVANYLMKKASFPILILIGGLMVGLIAYFEPYSVGPGIDLLNLTLAGGIGLYAIMAILVARASTVLISFNFGSSGGFFLPSIEIGALLGYLIGTLVNPTYAIYYALLGMAAMAAGVNKLVLVPVTFILEVVGAQIAIPVLLTSIASYFISMNVGIYEYQPKNKLDKGNFALEKFYAKAEKQNPEILEAIRALDIMNHNPIYIEHNKTVKDAYNILKSKALKVLPVVNTNGLFEGFISIDYLANLPTRTFTIAINNLEIRKGITVLETENLKNIIERMLNGETDHLFVIDKGGILKGVITEMDIIRYMIKSIT
ncbi:MAG: chloride channel protein [Nitrososphaerota archaeon]|jgi:CIC family chloride channel protein|nr:chloride channel protein [Nitrososphaerota archaeon]MDG6927216.1 chloride channel protein [Nitrososphaerota archaeon]MDG6929726.1 chloride channel protein [Nitrososphaerota archaeon]MDG6932659.1 chloride channel protein [Nitrososphaerota archaeon]MDG6936117.1 chloride channel protein [Nitrososphaerota archaeon]